MITRSGTATGDAVAAGRCAVMGMSYRLADGRVTVVAAEPPSCPPPAVERANG
jgi:hypothetical protein